MDCCTPTSSVAVLEPPVEAPVGPGPRKGRIPTLALIGPPNSGKSTLFNRLTGMRQKVANYPGVTVEYHSGRMKSIGRNDLTLIDLPGIYSLATYSEDARVAVDVLTGRMPGVPRPDCVLLVLDATHMNRQLMLAAPVFSIGLPTLVLLNMSDQLASRGGHIDTLALAKELGHPVALISASQGKGLDVIPDFLLRAGPKFDSELRPVQLPVLQSAASCRNWATQVTSRTKYEQPAAALWTRRLDAVLLHRWLGPIIFLLVVLGVFQVVFMSGQPLSDWMTEVLTRAGAHAALLLPDGWLRLMLRDGLWNGVQAVIVFLPQILLLFLFIGILEDSGYLARAALIADRTMAKFGLQGKSFIPLISAYACAVPAIMATRTIENKRDRLATILIAPLMTCSARLPVYLLIIGAFIADRPLLGRFFGMQAGALLGLYVLGFVAAIATARLLKSSILKSERVPFVLEMPPYRWPTLRSLSLRLIDRSKVFLRRAGTVILLVIVVLWVLENLPLKNGQPPEIADSFAGMIGHAVEPVIKPLGFNWKIGIGLVSSIAARETIVGTLGTIYGKEGTEDSLGLRKALRSDLTPGGAVALLIFFAFAMQCMSTVAVVRRETGGWKWPAIQFAYMTLLAYVCALITNQVVRSGILS